MSKKNEILWSTDNKNNPLKAKPIKYTHNGTSEEHILLCLDYLDEAEMEFDIEYRTDLWEETSIDYLIQRILSLAEQLVGSPSTNIHSLYY